MKVFQKESISKPVPFRSLIWIGLFTAGLIGYSLYLVYFGIKLHKEKKAENLNSHLHDVLESNLGGIINYIEGDNSTLPRLRLDVKFEEFQKFAYYRRLSIDRGYIFPEAKEDDISGKLTYGNSTYKVKLNVTGTNLDHLADPDKFSIKVKIKGDDLLMGLKEFGLLIPTSRGLISEWVAHELSGKMGLMNLRYDFAMLTINGTDMGLYVVEEHFEKRLVENNKMREGIIFKPAIDQIKVYGQKKLAENPALSENGRLLERLWQGFLHDEVPMEQLFDLEKIATSFAIADITNGHHSLHLPNVRYYFNPVTALIEPIGREWNDIRVADRWRNEDETSLLINHFEDYQKEYYSKFFTNENFLQLYVAALERISADGFLESFFDEIQPEFEVRMSQVHSSYPFYVYPREYLFSNRQIIKKELQPKLSPLIAHLDQKNGLAKIRITNQSSLPVEYLTASVNDTVNYMEERGRIVLPQKLASEEMQIELPILAEGKENNLHVYFKSLNSLQVRSTPVLPWEDKDEGLVYHPTNQPSNWENFHFLKEEGGSIIWEKGDWVLEETLILPADYTMKIEGGTTIWLRNASHLFSKGPLQWVGSKESPILIKSDGTAGVWISAGNRPSLLEFVIFDGLSNPNVKGWQVPGAISFYESPLVAQNCTFAKNQSEDGLNTFRGEVSLIDCRFEETFADAFDADFCKGSITRTIFQNTGNDAIDVSGSSFEVNKVTIVGASDKACSFGENSQGKITDLTIRDSHLGLTAKDKSQVIANNVQISNTGVALAAFQKKPEFGPGSITITNLVAEQCDQLFLLEGGSSLLIDGKLQVANAEALRSLLYDL